MILVLGPWTFLRALLGHSTVGATPLVIARSTTRCQPKGPG